VFDIAGIRGPEHRHAVGFEETDEFPGGHEPLKWLAGNWNDLKMMGSGAASPGTPVRWRVTPESRELPPIASSPDLRRGPRQHGLQKPRTIWMLAGAP